MKKIYMQPSAQFVAVRRNDIITGSSRAILDNSTEFEFYNEGVDYGI